MTFLLMIGIVTAVALVLLLPLNTAFIPGPLDEATRLETGVTKTATGTGTAFDLGAPMANAGIGKAMAAVVKPSACDGTDGNETYSFTLMESLDNVTFTACGPAVTLTRGTTVPFSVPGFVTKRYLRLDFTLGGTTPSVTYDAWLTGQGFPNMN